MFLLESPAILDGRRVNAPKRLAQFRWTRQLPPTARRLEHNFSASRRLSTASRTRYQKPLVPTFDRITRG